MGIGSECGFYGGGCECSVEEEFEGVEVALLLLFRHLVTLSSSHSSPPFSLFNHAIFRPPLSSRFPSGPSSPQREGYADITTSLCACANGYDSSLMTGVLAMQPYLTKFGTGTTGTGVSLVFSMYNVGSLIGSFPAAFVADKFGRRWGMWMGAVVIIFGMILVSSAPGFHQLVGGRFVLGCEY